jgi:hypothetical protein
VLDLQASLEQLRLKYVEMLAMRLDYDAGQRDARIARRRMGQLAAVFPGSLREIDELELSEIQRRIDALGAVLRGEQKVERWMEAVALFHAFARGALCAKRWLGGRKSVDTDTARAFSAAIESLPFPEDARVWQDDLPSIASPPRGRLTDIVFLRVASALGLDRKEARQLVFGVSRQERKIARGRGGS